MTCSETPIGTIGCRAEWMFSLMLLFNESRDRLEVISWSEGWVFEGIQYRTVFAFGEWFSQDCDWSVFDGWRLWFRNSWVG